MWWVLTSSLVAFDVSLAARARFGFERKNMGFSSGKHVRFERKTPDSSKKRAKSSKFSPLARSFFVRRATPYGPFSSKLTTAFSDAVKQAWVGQENQTSWNAIEEVACLA